MESRLYIGGGAGAHRIVGLAAFLCVAGLAVPSAGAQQRANRAAAVLATQPTTSTLILPTPVSGSWNAHSRTPGEGEAFVYSLVVPGLSQYRQGNRRWLLYAGTELLSALLYLDARADSRSHRSSYRDFAWSRARLGISSQPRMDGSFEYYETLSQWNSSGVWDADPARAGLQPESDPGTYNGWIWGLARDVFNVGTSDPEESPGYGRALEYYRERGYGPPFLWEWRRSGADREAYRALISESDRRAADARRALWMLTANHLFSAIDGFITARLAAMPPNGRLGLVARLPLPWPGPRLLP